MDVWTWAQLVAETVSHTGVVWWLPFWISIIIFVITFGIILHERIHRAVIWLGWALVMVLAGTFISPEWSFIIPHEDFQNAANSVHWFFTPEMAKWVLDFNTLWLLFWMMVMVAVLEHTWAFQYLWIKVAKKTKWNLWKLTLALWTLTTLLSLILDNVTTIILIAPITIIIAKMLKLNATPILMAEALLSDTGWVATLVWDPPNIMIGSAAWFSFNDFLIYSLPIVFVAWIATLITLKLVFRKELKQKPDEVAINDLMKMDEREAITDPVTLKKVVVVLWLVVLLFFLHSSIWIEPSMVAVIWATLTLFLVSATEDPQKILEKLELSVLLFFGSLFIIVGWLEYAWVLEKLAEMITSWAESNLLMTALVILWVSAVLSALVDNIPMTVAMLPILAYFQYEYIWPNWDIWLPGYQLLWWALVFWVWFGWNASPIWSTANVIVVSKSEQTDNPIWFKQWMKSWLTTSVASLLVASVWIYVLSFFIS